MHKNSPVTIIKGEDKTFQMYLFDDDGNPLDITGFDSVKVIAKKQDATLLTLQTGGLGVVSLNDGAGHIEVTVSDAQSDLLKEAADQTLEVEVNIGTDKNVIQFKKFLNVVARLA